MKMFESICWIYLFYHNKGLHQTVPLGLSDFSLYNFFPQTYVDFYNFCKGQMAAVSLH